MKSTYIQRKRTKGFNLQAQSPDGRPVVSCTRPSVWGNPYRVCGVINDRKIDWCIPDPNDDWEFLTEGAGGKNEGNKAAVALYAKHMADKHNDIRHHLTGKHLACWCAPGAPCHVQDVLLPIINGEEPRNYTK